MIARVEHDFSKMSGQFDDAEDDHSVPIAFSKQVVNDDKQVIFVVTANCGAIKIIIFLLICSDIGWINRGIYKI